MKNKFLLLMMLLCFIFFGEARAEEVIVGEATTASQYLPTYCWYKYSLTQQIYTADEIGTTGTISSVSFWCTTPDVERSLDIYLVNTDKSVFNGTTDWIAVTSADKVFSGTVSFLSNQWNTILLNSLFEYDGTHNLALIVDDNTGSYVSSYPSFNVYESSNQALRIYSDGTNYDPMAPSSYSGTLMTVKNQIKLNFPTCLPPTNVHIVDLTYNSLTMTWDFIEDDWVEYFLQKSIFFNPENMPWSYPFPAEDLYWNNLASDTDYTFGVRRYCSVDDQSEPVIMTIHTLPAPMTIPFTESFDATTLPDHWTKYTGLLNDVMNGAALQTTTYGWYFGASNGAFGGDNHTRINIYGSSCKYWLVTPQVTMQNNCQLSFELALTDYNGTMQPIDPTLQPDDRFVVLASTDGGSSWTILREWNNTGSPYVYNNILATGEDVAIDLSAYQGTNLMIAFYGESTIGGNGDNNLHIDNVSIDYIPECQTPTNFHVSSIAERSVVLSWDAPEGQNHWEVGYKTDDDPYYQWFVEPTENPYLFTGHPNHPLQPETHYTVMVQALCDGSGSSWSKEVEFTTLEACPVPTNLHITHVTPHGVTAYFDPGSPTQTIWYYNFTTTNTPPTYANGSTTSVQHIIYYPEEWQMFEPETHYYLWVGIECEEGGTTYWAWGEPAEFTTPEACPPPTDLTITDVTPHGVSATFTPGGDWQTEWGYYYTTTNEPPGYFNGVTLEPSAIYPEWLHALQSNTHYYLWVGIECEEDGTTTYVWGEPAEFTTPYACSTVVNALDIEIDDVQPHEVSLDWGDSPATADQWQVCYSYYDMLPPESSMSDNSVIVNGKYATIDGLFPDLEYHFWIRALCEVWEDTPEWGEWSDMITVHTETSCYPPINVTVSNITSTTATISWDPNPSTTIPVEYYEVNIESDDWGDIYVAYANEPYLELDFEGWVDEGEDLPCTVYVHAYCGQIEGLSEASETVGFILTDKEQLTVNDGTATNEYVPIYGFYCDLYSKGQFIIPAEDIEDMRYSEISWMTFYASNDYVNWDDAEFEVYMMELPCETEFASASLYDWYDMELVRSEGSLYISDGLMVVDLEEPFYYTDGNLLIGFKQTVIGSWEHSYWYGVNTNANTALGGFESAKGISFQQFLPKISFIYESTSNYSVCRRPENFTVERVNATTIQFSWTPGSDDQSQWEIAWGGENFDPYDNTTWMSHSVGSYNPCWINVFTPDMNYNFAIRAVCSQDQGFYSNWTCPVSFFLENCPTPTNVTISNVTTTEATVNWEDVDDTWIVLYRCDYDEITGFETQTLEGWTSQGDAAWTVGVGDNSSATGAHSGGYNAKITHTVSGNETWLISPMMDLTNVDVVYLDFWYINRRWGDDIDELGVYYRIDGGEWHEAFISDGAHGTWTSQHIYLGFLATNDNCQIGFKMTDHYGYGVGLDDIQISGYKYAGSCWAYFPAQSFTFTNLNPNTTYWLYLQSSCDGIDSNTTDPIFFTTLDSQVQTIALTAGWNWFSTSVVITLDDLKAALVEALPGATSITINTQGSYTTYNGTRWRGTLNDNAWDVSKMYTIQVPEDCEIELEGAYINPADHPVTIRNGVNYIAFPLSEGMSLSTAFAGFAVSGDVVQAQGSSSTYTNRWRGTLSTLEPGKGYLYISNSAGDRPFTFPTGAK